MENHIRRSLYDQIFTNPQIQTDLLREGQGAADGQLYRVGVELSKGAILVEGCVTVGLDFKGEPAERAPSSSQTSKPHHISLPCLAI